MSFISYAQNYEDVMLRRALRDVDKGFYIDAGANDPVIDSVTKAFYDAGWRGINIEPVAEWFEKLQQNRPDDINLQLALGARKGEVNFYEVVGTGLSTISKLLAQRHADEHGYKIQHYRVPVARLTTICEEHAKSNIHFLKIDVEGSEQPLLKGINLKKIRPWIILVESTEANTQVEKYGEWEHLILNRGYHHVYFDGLNRYYVADEHKNRDAAFLVPPNVFDQFKRASEEWSEHRITELLTELNTTREEITAAEESRRRLTQDIQSVEMRLEVMTKEKVALKSEYKLDLEAAHQQTEQLAAELGAIGEVKAALEVTNQQLECDIQVVKKNLEVVNKEFKEQHAQAQWLKNELDLAKSKADEFNHSSDQFKLEAERLNQELHSVYSSKFWRITWPVRVLMQFFKWLCLLPIRFTAWVVHLPKRIVCAVLIKTIRYLSRRQKLRSKLLMRLNNYPRIKVRLKSYVINHGLAATYAEPIAHKEKVVWENNINDNPIEINEATNWNDCLEKDEYFAQLKVSEGANDKKKSPLEKWFY